MSEDRKKVFHSPREIAEFSTEACEFIRVFGRKVDQKVRVFGRKVDQKVRVFGRKSSGFW